MSAVIGGDRMDKAENLRKFFADPRNQTTRERIFFNRLNFDMKIAAARFDYHLHMYEPDVDRDGFDIVVEHDGWVRWHQTKAVLSSAATAAWDINAGLLWPDHIAAENYGYDPVEAGRGGGVVLIEIDDQDANGEVVYSYTDYDILIAISDGFIVEKLRNGRGRPASPTRTQAENAIADLRCAKRGDKVSVGKKLFVRLSGPDDLLGVMGLHTHNGYGMYATRAAYRKVEVDQSGKSISGSPVNETSNLHYHMGLLCAAQPAPTAPGEFPAFKPFEWVKQR